ncbi:MAG: hypothetical protein KF804_10145 [Burkholderiales bacterium]|nr:hypothetical protein [Burkholderiales bacterium]
MIRTSTFNWLLWGAFAVLALLWTAGSYIAAALARWGAQALAGGGLDGAGRVLAQPWPLPEVMAPWLEPAMLQALQQTVLVSLDGLREALPFMGAAMGWLVPLIWTVWGLGLVCMLALAGGAHWLWLTLSAPGPGVRK